MTNVEMRNGLFVPDETAFADFVKNISGLNVVRDGDDHIAFPPMAGGAEIFPDEGLDHVLAKVPGATVPVQTTYYLFLITGGTSSTVPARTEVLATPSAAVAEPSGGAYARVAVANTDWGAPTTSGNGRRRTSAQKSFAENTASWGNINGFGLATASTLGTAIFYANFDDLTAVPATVAGYTVRVTPYFHIDQ